MADMMGRKQIQSEIAMNLRLNLRFQLFIPFCFWMTACFASGDALWRGLATRGGTREAPARSGGDRKRKER